MPLLKRQDWVKLRDYRVAFTGMSQDLFELLLNKVYGPTTKGNPANPTSNPGEADEIDALMMYCAHAEPPIPPPPKL